jgi:hypothetical protein
MVGMPVYKVSSVAALSVAVPVSSLLSRLAVNGYLHLVLWNVQTKEDVGDEPTGKERATLELNMDLAKAATPLSWAVWAVTFVGVYRALAK